jgi:8-oxo-dGTP pyrophosphatase MutT (NUDIX family)/phosphohistidine phosphatase SixA
VTVTPTVLAAGAVVWRAADDGIDVLLVHRPKYDDWSFPKGKLDPGEHMTAAAVREVAEETGQTVRLGPPLRRQEYQTAPKTTKLVYYWAARVVGDDRAVDDYQPNAEIDEVVWLPLDQAPERLSYPRDADILVDFGVSAYRSEPLVVLRHTRALPRNSWPGHDRERGLSEDGEREARALVPLLRAYGIRRVLSSDAVRCTATVQPYADACGLRVEVDHRLSEEGLQDVSAARRIDGLLRGDEPTVVCSHRPVLPSLFGAAGVRDPGLRPGAFVVVHREHGQVRATEHHWP